MSKASILFVVFSIHLTIVSQNNQVIYDFNETPQTLLLNPGSNYSHDFFIGIPLLSGVSLNGGVTGVTVYDIFADDGRNINDKINDVIYSLNDEDSFIVNEKVEIISAGFRLKNDNFLSFGFYEEFDFAFYYPSDMAELFYEGTSNLNKQYSLEGLNFKGDLLGVLHAGISHKVNKKFTIGGRIKLYSSVFNVQSKNNRGEFSTTLGTNNIYTHHFLNFDATVQTTGIVYDDGKFKPNDFIKKLYAFENLGVGFDVGFTYKMNEQLQITGSVLDIGFVKNSKDISTYYIRGNHDLEGIQLVFDPDTPSDYWRALEDEFENNLPLETLYTKYNSYRPLKLNASTKYSFGKPYYEDCFESNANDPYRNSVGIQLYAINRPIKSQLAATLFYERGFGDFLRTKLTYTLDSYSSSNIGFGVSAKMGPINLYMAFDNLLYLQNLAKANSTSFQLGVNIIIDNKFP